MRVERVSFPREKRVIAVSDVHGHKTWLERLLKKVGFCGEDILVLCGDYVERGRENLEALRYVMELSRLPNVYALVGNVDAWRCVVIEDPEAETPEEALEYIRHKREFYGPCTLTQMAQELGMSLNTPEEIVRAKKAFQTAFQPELEFLHTRPVILEDDRFVFVHGGLTGTDMGALEGAPAFPLMKNDAFLHKGLSFRELGKTVVVGHWPVVNYGENYPDCTPILERERGIVSIDGGCGVKDCGQLNALLLEGDQIRFESYDDLQEVVCLDDQEESKNSANIMWVDRYVELLERGAEFSRVRKCSDGRSLYVPNFYLFEEEEKLACRDYTDYRIGVRAGDRVKLVRREEFGVLIKKNGRVGWYRGRAEMV